MSKFSDKLIGNKTQFGLEHRIFNISLLVGILMSVLSAVLNFIIGLAIINSIIGFLCILIFLFVLTYSIKKIKLSSPAIFTFLFLILILSPVTWITSGGLNSVIPYYMFFFAIVIIIVLKGNSRIILLSLLILVVITLLIFENQYPELIIPYPSEEARYLDLILNVPIVIAIIILIIYTSINQYKLVNSELIFINNLLEIQNAEIEDKGSKIEIQKNKITTKVELLEMSNTELETQNVEYDRTLKNLEHILNKLKKTQDMLIESEKMAAIGNLVAGVAHEMNTPIGIGVQATSGIIDRTTEFAKKLKNKEINNIQLINYLNYVYESNKLAYKNLSRLGELINSFKLVSVDQSTEELRKFNLKSYCTDILNSLQSKFRNKDIKVKVECDEKLEIVSYPGVFAQITTNLVINSILHGFENQDEGQILIRAEKDKENLKIIYKDNGKGMSEYVLKRLFEPFFTTNKKQGTGLGMHIIYNLVTQKLDGNISCKSKPDDGVTFTILIPVE